MPSFCSDCGEPANDMGKCRRCGKPVNASAADAAAQWGRDGARTNVSNQYLNNSLTSVNASGAGVAQRGQGADPTLRSMLGDADKFLGPTASCADCKQVASPSYSVTEGGPKYCADCYRKHGSKCDGCGKHLEGEFVLKDGKKYHKQCFSSDAQCERCRKVIFGQAVQALNHDWHPACFTCCRCNAALTDSFLERNGDPYCTKCGSEPNVRKVVERQETPAERAENERRAREIEDRNAAAAEFRTNVMKGKELTLCVECGRNIMGNGYTTIGDIQRHVECTKCSKCSKSIGESDAVDKDGDLFCSTCAGGKAGPNKCVGCLKMIEGKYVANGPHKYHQRCLRCTYCNKPFEGTQMAEKDGNFFHPACAPRPQQQRTVVKAADPASRKGGFVVDPITGQKKYC